MSKLSFLHKEILKILQDSKACYSRPVNSNEIAKLLNITPSYIRGSVMPLKKQNIVGVRRGSGGGFFLL
jgi:DNA-binding IscR family transcriptional regulator